MSDLSKLRKRPSSNDSEEETTIKIPASTDEKVNDLQSERSSLDSYHDNQYSRQHPIINKLYNNKTSYLDEDKFIDDINTKTIPDEYYVNRNERLEKRLKGFFTTRMECLVNDTPFNFNNTQDELLTFVYDQGSHPINYFKNSINGLFVSDAIDTAPKLTNKSQKGKIFNTPDIIIPGSYIGFNENIIEVVVFSDFKSFGDQVGCKVLIKANLSEDNQNFRWYNLAQKFDTTNNALRSYENLQSVKQTLDYKKSNDKYTGFFIGNANAKKLLEDKNLKPIIALFIVTAKILGDFSSAIASSPTLTNTYTTDPLPKMFIHASGDRLCSLEASRQGADAIKTYPRNSDGIIPIQYIPGININQPINYKQRFNTIHTEIIKRFDDLLKDVGAFDINKYRVDGETINSSNLSQVEKLEEFVESLTQTIKKAKDDVEKHITSIAGQDDQDYDKKYETLYHQKIVLMPQAPLISTRTKKGVRKNLRSNFHICRIPNSNEISIDLRGEVFRIILNSGGKRKLRRRTPRRSRGGMDINTPLRSNSPQTQSTYGDSQSEQEMTDDDNNKKSKENPNILLQEFDVNLQLQQQRKQESQQKLQQESQMALKNFNEFIDDIRERIFKFALSSSSEISIDEDDPFIEEIQLITHTYGSTNRFIELVKQNRHKLIQAQIVDEPIVDEDETKEREPKTPKVENPEEIYIADYDEEFMEELEEAIYNYQLGEISEDNSDITIEDLYDYEDDDIIELIKGLDIDQYGITPSNNSGGKRKNKRKTYRRIRLF